MALYLVRVLMRGTDETRACYQCSVDVANESGLRTVKRVWWWEKGSDDANEVEWMKSLTNTVAAPRSEHDSPTAPTGGHPATLPGSPRAKTSSSSHLRHLLMW